MSSRKRGHFITVIFAIICQAPALFEHANAQLAPSTAPSLASVIPVSPNAASLGKYGEVPVGYYTGVPNISVPIYEINTGSIKLPISLSYHAGGIKVEEMASWVGLGWSLNGGGVISRQVRGIADELGGGYLATYHDTYRFINGMSSGDQQTYFDNVNSGSQDSQPDMFSFNFGSESGQFFFDTTGQVTQMPATRNKFEFGTFLGVSNTWKVTTINGEQYYFIAKELSQATISSNGSLVPSQSATTSWYLTEIVNALATDTVRLEYAANLTGFHTITSQTKYFLTTIGGTCSFKGNDDNTSSNTITGWHLSRIIFRNGSVRFLTNTQTRCDYPGDSALSSIEVRNETNTFYKKFQLYQSYITSNSSSCDTTHPENSRLLLDSMIISGFANPEQKYSFNYNKTPGMPSRLSYNQDRWGYYNGADNQTVFVPVTDLATVSGATTVLTGADREVHADFTKALVLQSVTYPTGGRTEFEFENNTISNPPAGLSTVVGNHSFAVNPNNNPGGTGPRLYIDTTFTLDDDFQGMGGVNADININNGGGSCAISTSFDCPRINITRPDSISAFYLASETVFFPKGTYHVVIDLTGPIDSTIIQNFFFQISWDYDASMTDSLRNNAPVSGLRVKKITDFNADNSIAKIKKYTYLVPDSVNMSSGTLLSVPRYIGSIQIGDCTYTTISSGSNLPMIETQGSYVGYRNVQEYLGASGEFGKNEFEYTAPDQFADRIITDFPFPPSTSFEWKRGQMIHEKNYRYDSSYEGLYTLVQEKINTYADNSTTVVQGIKIGQNVFDNSGPFGTPGYQTSQFSTESGWFPLIGDTTRVYDQNNSSNYSQVIHSYAYNTDYFLPVSDTTTDSKGQTVITNTKYPLDYSGLSGTDAFSVGIYNLQNKNVIASPVEKYTQLQNPNGTNNRVTNAVITSYKPDKPLPDTVWTTELNTGTTSFSASSVASGKMTKSNLYRPRILFPKYDSQGNIIEQQKISDVRGVYVWDYQQTYPIAEIKNADSGSVAYTSFEADGGGGWTISSGVRDATSITGRKSYNLVFGSVSKSGLSTSKNYIVSYWSNNGSYSITGSTTVNTGKTINGWTYYTHRASGNFTITISGSGLIDELRLYPAGAQMTTYTYDPLVGMTSQCDVNNRITYYEYDGFQRLKLIRDQDHNILKSYEYQYQASSGCGANCFITPIQTQAGSSIRSYPVGVFNVNGKLLGNATNQAGYISLWNADTANSNRGTLAAGPDSLHFQVSLNTGKTLPPLTACRYYQVDLAWNKIDGVRWLNGVYVDFGDGTGMATPKTQTDTPSVLAPNTVAYTYLGFRGVKTIYLIHTYADTSLKTLTFYHNDAGENEWLDNATSPATGLARLKNLRGYLPQNSNTVGGSCFQQASMTSLTNIANWNAINTVTIFDMNKGDGINAMMHLSYAQDFMQNNKGLNYIRTSSGYRASGYLDTSFRLSRLKSNWNTYFTGLQTLMINDDHWNREDLSALTQLNFVQIYPSTQDHQDGASSPFITIPTGVIDNILNQVAAGAGRTVQNGMLAVESAGPARSAASDTAVQTLHAMGWTVIVNDIVQ